VSSAFFKSTFSGGDQTCVEVAHTDNVVLIRDSKYTGPARHQPIISIPAEHWPTVLELALNRESGTLSNVLTIAVHRDGSATLTDPRGVELAYHADEYDAFAKGIADGQFDRPRR
jgi:hypothetical protein